MFPLVVARIATTCTPGRKKIAPSAVGRCLLRKGEVSRDPMATRMLCGRKVIFLLSFRACAVLEGIKNSKLWSCLGRLPLWDGKVCTPYEDYPGYVP